MMAYGYSIKNRSVKKTRGKTRQPEPRWILASLAMAAGIFAAPFGVVEAAIVDKNGTAINPTGNVYNIDPQGGNGNFVYNRFAQFVLEQGYIANLKFNNADILANLVNSKIDINGVVNGIKNGKIDGHLMFLSPDGIAIGASGVINAGQFTGIVPTRTAFETLYNAANPDTAITMTAIEKLTSYANDKSIEVSGQINTHSGVMLGAGIINIKDGAKIQSTKNLDFTSLVNIKDGASAGLTLTTAEGTGGDIILTAKQESDVKDTKPVLKADGTVDKDDQGKDKTEANAVRWKDRSTDLSAAINIGMDATSKGVSITSSDGAVKLTAESTSTYEDSTPMTLTDTLRDVIFGADKTVIDGLIDKLAKKESGANKYLFANYSNKKNKASVNIGGNSSISGKNIDIAATSKVEIKQSIAIPTGDGKKDSEGNTVASGSKAIAAVAISRVFNNADVVIDGNLIATGADANGSGIKIAANADTKVELSATGSGGDANIVAAGVAVLSGDTKSKVTVNTPTNAETALKATQGKVSVEAVTQSDANVNVNIVGSQSYVSSNVGVANYDTGADVTMNGSVSAGAVDIKAENTVNGLKMTVDNAAPQQPSGGEQGKDAAGATEEEKQQDNKDANAEKNKGDEGKSEDEKNSEKKSVDPTKVIKDASVDTKNDDKTKDAAGKDGKGGVQDVKDKVEGTNEGGDNAKKNSAFGVGAAVGVVSNVNNANVIIGKNSIITATPVDGSETIKGAVNVSANTLMTASAEKEDGLALSVKNTQSGANVEIGAAVLVSNVKNNANVLLDSDGDKSAQVKGDEVSLDAKAGMGTYKATQPKKDENGNDIQGQTEEVEKTSTLTYTVSASGTAEDDTPSKFVLDGSVGVNTLKNNAVVLLGQNSKVDGTEVKLSSDATTNAEGTYGATDNNTTVGIGATVGIQNIRGNSLVMVGKGASITGSESFEASAEENMDLKNTVQNAGKGESIGVSGMVALSYGDSNSIVSIDDEANINTGFATITSTNSTNVENSARSESTGQNGAKAFGIGVGIVNYDVNSLAMVSDNGSGITAPSGSTTDSEKAAKKIYEDAKLARDVAGNNFAGKLGTKTDGAKGSITTGGLVGMALTTGMIQNDAKAKGVSAPASSDTDENERTDSEKWTKWSKKGEEGANDAKKNTENLEEDKVTSQNESKEDDGSPASSAGSAAKEASTAANPDDNPMDDGAAPTAGSHESAGASIGIEGSVALTFLGGRTDAVLDNVTVKNESDGESAPVIAASLSATDFLGSITMGGTTTKHSVNAGDSGTKVGIGGTFAMNSSNRDVDSLIRNSDLQQALMVSNSASKIGIEVAAGMGVATAEGDGANINGAGVVYYNRAKQDVHALMLNTNVTGVSVSNEATSTDFQIAGGLAGTKGGGSNANVGVGGAVAISNLENDLKSGIVGGEYTVLGSVDVKAEKGTTQINGALAGTKGGYGFEGAFAYGSTKNTTRAYIEEGATVTSFGDVNVKAGEVPVVKTDTQLSTDKTNAENKIDSSIDTELDGTKSDKVKTQKQLDDSTKTNAKNNLKQQTNDALQKEADQQKNNKKTLDDAGLDTTGESYLDKSGDEKSSLGLSDDEKANTDGGKIAGEAAKDESDAKDEVSGDANRSITITAAMGGGWNDKVGAGAGIAYNYVKNDVAADIKGSTITANAVNGEAATDSLIVSVGAGIAIGGKTFNGAGSGSWNDLKNDTKVTFADNTILGKSISEKAKNEASIINIAGEVAGGKGSSLGLSLAYNSLNNTTGTYLTGNTVALTGELTGDANSVSLSTENKSKALAVAGGVDVDATSKGLFGASGTVSINRGTNNTESVIDGKTTGENTTLTNVKELSVTASDLTKKTTVAGGISVGGVKVGIGGSVAYTSVGTSGNKERLRAEVNHADVTTTNDGTITVSTTDNKTENGNTEKSRVTTVGAGIGVEWGKSFFNLHGAAAVSDIYKDSRASLNNTNINAGNADAHPTIDVTADSKSKINTVGAVGNISVNGKVSGTAGVAINRINQDTTAEMATDSGTTAVNAGRTEVRATGDADIHSVGVGGTVAINEYVSFAGSGSYNYIGNNVNATVKNQNLKANKSVGVVAQSDDRLYNFAGGFNIGANTRAAIGAAVGINKITGSTNALVSGGSVAAADDGNIAVTRPQDDKLFTTESLDLTTDRTQLSESRATENKTGVVVDSSATHTLISQQSSGGVAASSSVGVNLAGTVNLNTIEGSTTAKVQDADLNSADNASNVADNASNVNVNAVDYANVGSFTGTPSVGAGAVAGVSLGVSANWETLNRTTAAEISSSSDSAKKYVFANNLTVDATAKHGSSALSFAAAAGGAKVGVASGDSIMRHKYNNTVSALMKNTNAQFDGKAEILAEHLGNSHSQNIAASVSAGMVAVSAGAGVSVTDDTSKVTAEVADSKLEAKESTDGKDISVLAKNENNRKNTLVTASLAVGIGAGLAANVGINNTTGETAALVTNSDLKAHDVTVKATDKLTAKGTGGVGAGGVGGVGVAVTLNNINSSVSAHVTGGSVTASNNIDVAAEEERKFDSQVTGASAGGIGVGVNVAVTSINKGITDAQLSSAKDENEKSTGVGATTQNEISKHVASVNGANGALGASGDKFAGIYGLNADDKKDLNAARNTSVSLATPSYDSKTPDTRKQGVHTETSNTILTAGNDVNVTAKDTSDVFAKNVGVTAAGAASVNVTDAIIHTNYDTDVTMNGATIEGKNVNVNALQTQAAAQDGKQGSDVRVTAVTVGALGGVGVGYAGIVNKGATDVNIAGSTIKSTENVTINATDESKHRSDILSVGVAALNVTTTFASVENKNNVGVTLGGTNNISASGNVTIDAKRANALEAHTQGVGVGGVNVAVNHATIEDGGKDENNNVKGLATAKITGTTNITGKDENSAAEKFHLGATNDATAKLSSGNVAVSVLGISTMRGKGVMDMGAETSVAGGSFNAKTVEFTSMLGNANGRTIEGNVKGHNISVGAVAPDTVRLETTATGKVDVKNSTFGENANLILNNESYVDRKGYIYDVTVGGIAVGNSRAIISGNETLNTSLAGKSNTTSKLAGMEIVTYGENVGKALADAGGGGLVGYVGAHVDNKSINRVSSTLGGTWDVAGEVYLVAAQKDETKLTAKEGHGGVIGVGGTSAENKIDTATNATVANNTVINADRTHIGTVNAVAAGAYDDTDGNGNKDEQTYTLKDHFGGAIVGNRLRSLLDLTENGTVTIGSGAKITTNNLQEYIAASQNDLTNHASAKGGAAVGIVDAVTENKITVNNTVDVKGGAALNNEKTASTEDIILAAYDEQKLNSHAEATVGGVAGVMVSKNLNTMNRTSNVNVAGTIESGSKVGLYAGANEGGALSNLNVDLKAGAYNHTAIPISSPTVEYNNKADNGMVNVSGTVRSTGDINVIASGGREKIAKDESLFNWVKGGSSTDKKFLSSDAVVAEEAMPKTSKVTVTGSLIAGTANPINLTIGGSVANGLTITADNNDANNRVKNGVTQGTFDYANTLGARLDELNKLISAYDGANADNGGTEVMAAYIAERDRIQTEMGKLGLAEKDTDGKWVYSNSGRPVYYVEIPDIATSGGNINVTANDFVGTGNLRANSAPGVTITNQSDAYLKLNNIIMGEKGGQITYNGIDNVIPPNVSQGNAKINSINVSKSGAAFREIYGVTDGQAANLSVQNTFSGSRESTITVTEAMKQLMRQEVQNDTSLSEANKTQLLNEINSKNSFTYTAIPDVEVNGKISNFHGQVEINNQSGDIRISGGTQARPTGVFGNTVRLTAGQGTIAQDYKEGIVNINGDPEKYLDSYTSYTDNSLITAAETNMEFEEINAWANNPFFAHLPPYIIKVRKAGTNKSGNAKTTYTRPDSANTATGYIAGRDVYVSASNVNVNGLIQSGYKNYTATVTDAQLNAAKARPADRAAVVQNRTMYKVNDGGAKWSTTDNAFYYEAQVYWDPSTNQLFVEDIDTAGGRVYLTGKIAGTGDGRILAADGAALITVTNETALDMNVGKVLNNQREGVITIADTAKDTWTEYKKGQTRTVNDYAAYLKAHANDGDPYAGASVTTNTLSVTQSLTYTPKENQTYNWTKGKTVESVKEYEHFKRYGLWGAVKTQDVNSMRSEAKVIREVQGKEYGLPEGAVIQQGSNTGLTGNDLRLDTTSNRLDHYTTTPVTTLKKTGFFGWFRNYYTRWEEGEKVLKTYNYSISASQPITIGLIGDETGKIDIKSTNAGGGSINLTGNVANSHHEAELNISSAAGGIFQNDNTTLKSEIVNLTAKEDIKNIHLASVGTATKDANGNVTSVNDNIQLSAVSNNKGDIDITAVGGILENRSLPGNVEIIELKSKDGNNAFSSSADLGDVTLTANGNITQSGSGANVEGRGINLTSNNGGIGTESQAVNILGSDLVYSTDRYGAQVNAEAKGNIYLTEAADGGDMRVGKIESREGDVKLTVTNGGFIDGLPGDDKSGSNDSADEMVHRWIDAGLIDGEKDANGNYTYKGAYITGLEKDRDNYKARITSDYTEYDAKKTAVNAVFASSDYQAYRAGTGDYAGLTDAQKSAKLLVDGHQDYLTYKDYATADDYLKNTDGYKFNGYASADDYLAADATYQDLKNKAENPTFEWTKDMMLYAVSDKLVNPESGSSAQTDRAANVLGNNITLTSTKGAVGNVSDQTTTITVEQLTGDKKITYMKQLMNVSASDVKAVRDDSGNLTEFVITPNMPLGVYLKDKTNQESGAVEKGTLNVQAGGNVSVAGRKDANGEHSAINVGTIDATQTGDVRLYSEQGIYNAKTANDTNITGKNLVIAGGKESIGTSDTPLTVSLTGDLTEARADKNVFIKNMKQDDYIRLGAMYAADTISLASEKGFLMSEANGNIADSYINAGKKLEFITNVNTGIVGNSANAIRILNDRAPVNIEAKSAYIHGVDNSSVKNGTLVLGKVKTQGEFVAIGDGSIEVGREEEINSNGTVKKEKVEGSIESGGDVTLKANDSVTLDGTVKADTKTLNLTATNGSITQTDKGAITADKVNTVNGKSLLLENTENKFNSITVDGITTASGETPAIAGDVRIKDNADALKVEVKRDVTGDISVENLQESGTLTNEGNLTATGNIGLKAKGDLTQAAGTTVTAGKDVTMTSTDGALAANGNIIAANNVALSAKGDLTQAANTTVTAGKDVSLASTTGAITQDATAGIAAQNVSTVSAKTVDLQGTGNQFSSLTVQSSDENTGIQGSVLVKDNADKLTLSVQPVVNGNIAAENTKAQGTLNVVSELHAEGDGANAKGDVTLKSDGSMQSDKKIAAKNEVKLTSTSGAMTIGGDVSADNNITLQSDGNMQTIGKLTSAKDVKLTATSGDVSIRGDVSTGETMPSDLDLATGTLKGPYNSLAIHAGGAITEAAGVKIETPVVDTKSGKGVSMESANNQFVVFTADKLAGNDSIDGSVKATTNYYKKDAEADAFTVGVGAAVKGDAAFTNLDANGSLGILILHPDNENDEIEILGGNGAAGNLSLTAQKDVMLLGDSNAKNDIVVDSANGSFYGIGKGMKAGNDVSVTAGDSVNYIGTIYAANDINLSVTKPSTDDSGIYIGALPNDVTGATSLTAGNNARFDVKGNGDIVVGGSVKAGTGDVTTTVSGKGDVTITGSVESEGASVSVQTGKGNINIGSDNNQNEETVKAKQNVNVETDLGTVYILGKTTTETGDITMKAGQETYEAGTEHGNFIIRDDGKLVSGGGVGLYGRNGDIDITDDIQAKKGITVHIAEQGNASFGRDVTVTNDVDIYTDKGSITVGKTVNSDEGTIRLQSGSGDISVGKDITAGKDITISSAQGDIAIGDATTDDEGVVVTTDGDVLSKTGNVSIETGKGNIGIARTVTAEGGSIDISSGHGEILIGNNGPDVKTVMAKENIDLTAEDGKVIVYGKTSTENGDISITARMEKYTPGDDGRTFIIDQNGKLEAGGAINLNVGNGDLHVSDRISAEKDLVAKLEKEGSIYFDTDVDVKGKINLTTADGDINVGHEAHAGENVDFTTNNGDINVGSTVISTGGDVNMKTTTGSIVIGDDVKAHDDVTMRTTTGDVVIGNEVTAGDSVNIGVGTGEVLIEKAVTAEGGSIAVNVGKGGVTIGDNGPDVETVTAKQDATIEVGLGKIKIYGKTSTEEGDITLSAAESNYTKGSRNIIIDQNGLVDSGRDVNLKGTNGDLHVTDAIKAKRNVNADVDVEGGVYFDRSVNVDGNVTATTVDGDINVTGEVTGNKISMETQKGSIEVTGDITANESVSITTGTGNIAIENVKAQTDTSIAATRGNITATDIMSGGNTKVSTGVGDIMMNDVRTVRDTDIAAGSGNITTTDIISGGNAKVSTGVGDITMHDVKAGNNADISNTVQGSVTANDVKSNGTTRVALTKGDLIMNVAEGKAVLLLMEDNTEASHVNGVLANSSGSSEPDVGLTGNYIHIDSITSKGGNDVFMLSAIGAKGQKLIGGDIRLASLRSLSGTEMPSLWSNRGFVHVDEGNFRMNDVLAVDKIHFENKLTDVAVFGRTPTRDGEQLVYWNNLGMADSKQRMFNLYTDGKLRTSRAVLIDAERNYSKLFGDNLSVVDMMRERVTSRHGEYTFDITPTLATGEALKQDVVIENGFAQDDGENDEAIVVEK